jgi:serine/threonine protein kinase
MNDYVIDRILGKGAFGTVHLGTERESGKPVVIKEILKSNLTTPAQVRRAQRDSIIPKKFLGCHHKNIICVVKWFENETAVYIVSEYVEGVTTLTRYKPDLSTRGGQLELLDIFQQLADGLAYMHSRGIAHGDIKLANILIKGNIPFYIDFDLACTFRESTERPTLSKSQRDILPNLRCRKGRSGTPNYMAPEIVSNHERDPSQSDIYALGVVFFIVITRKPPFERGTLDDTYTAIINDPVPEFGSGLPDLDTLIRKMLTKSLHRPTAGEVRDTLNELIRLI